MTNTPYPQDKKGSDVYYGASNEPSPPAYFRSPDNTHLSPTPGASGSSRSHEQQTNSGSQSLEDEKALEEDSNSLIDAYLPPVDATAPPPFQGDIVPFCLPQLGTKAMDPFARGYNPALGISQEQLLSFVDGLNLAITGSPPLRVVDIIGQVVGFIPNHWCMLAGALIQTGAQTAMRVLSKTLTDRYLRSANERLFHPRGLSVRICTTSAAFKLIGAEIKPVSKTDAFGRKVGSALLRLPLPLTKRVIHAIADKPPTVEAAHSNDPPHITRLRRRLKLVEGRALPVQIDDLPPPKRTTFTEKMNGVGVALDQRKIDKTQARMESRRNQLDYINKQGVPGQGMSGPTVDRRTAKRMAKMERLQSRAASSDSGRRRGRSERKMARIERRMERADLKGKTARRSEKAERRAGKKVGRLERRVASADLREHWGNTDVLWVVVMDRRIDDVIEGVAEADSKSNTENIPEKAWQEELEREYEEMDSSDSDSSDDSSDDEEYDVKKKY